MTVFFGVFGINNHIDCISDLNAMMQSLADSPADKSSTWHKENIALGQKTVHNTPESLNETLPLHHIFNNLTIVGNIRLDNRAELFVKLSIPRHEQENSGDAHLILAAYQKWGESCPDHFLGNFSFIIWDGTKQQLVCCTDHFGTQGLFYYYNGKKFVFASTPNEILAIKSIPSGINQNKLSTLIFKDAKHLYWGESWFENIFPMAAATILIVDRTGLRKRKYWEPQIGKELSFKNDEEYAEAFQEVIFKAVSDRLRSPFPVTALLSGGLDSSAVVSVAAKILEKQNKELQVFSAVLANEKDPSLTDERYFIDQFRSFPNVNINYITAPDKGFFSDLHQLQTTIYAPNLISRHYLYTDFAEKAQALGARVILDGGGGESGVTFYGYGGYTELFCQMRWFRLWQEVKARKKLLNESVIANLIGTVKPLAPDFIVNMLRRDVGLAKTREHCIQPDFAAMLKMRLELRKKELESFSKNTVSSSHRKNQINMLQISQIKAQGSADLGFVEIRHPLKDKRLLEFCLNSPLDYKINNGYQRYAVRAGLNKILPPEIQWRNSKGAFSPDYNRRYKEQLFQAQEFLSDISPNDPVRKIVDVEKIKAWTKISVRDEEYGTFAEKTARDFVPQGIYLIHFLRRFKEFQI